jgi:VWFA-related protein
VTVHKAALVLAVLVVGVVPARSQEKTGEAPVFEAGVELVAIDVSVVDGDGRPVQGLGPEDFEVRVDGRPRRVVSVEFRDRDVSPLPATPRPSHYSTNEDDQRGRLILLLVDRGSISRGGERNVLLAADRFLDTLGPGDLVALAVVPNPGPAVEFTPRLDEVRRALKGVVGQADRGGYRVSLADAVGYLRDGDRIRWDELLDRECGRIGDANQRLMCQQGLEAEASQVMLAYRERSSTSLKGLSAVLGALVGIEGPKTVILVSEGLGSETADQIRELAAVAARARVSLFVVLVDSGSPDASRRPSDVASQADRDTETMGLDDLAVLARGTVVRATGTGEGAFERIAREMTGFYLLGVEPDPGDRDGRDHRVRVQVARPRTTVRAPGLLNIPTRAPGVESQLAALLGSPLVERDLAVRVTTYALHPAQGRGVRLVIATEIGRAKRPVSVAFALVDSAGRVVASRGYHDVTDGTAEWVRLTADAVVEPGAYELRVAAIDAAARRGSVRHLAKAVLVSAGGLEISDLVLAPRARDATVQPAVDLEAKGGALSALVEVSGPDPERLAQASVFLEVADAPDGPALVRVPALLQQQAGSPRSGLAQVSLGGGLLPPGDYFARASIMVEGKPVAASTRPFRIVPAPPGAGGVQAPFAGLAVRAAPFDRAELVSPPVLLHFLDRLAELVPGPAPAGVEQALAEARAGRPEAMVDRLEGMRQEDVRAAFLRGVGYYARGNFNAALTQLRSALRLQSDLFPAAVYMGGCYAAGGKDQDAIGAWQTALVGESDTPALYSLLSDALVREHDPDGAVAVLSEGLDAFPEDPALRRRLGLAHALAGHGAEALALLTDWVDRHPEDTTALFATLTILFEAVSRPGGEAASAEARERLLRYARAYVAARGENREVIERWVKYLRATPGS